MNAGFSFLNRRGRDDAGIKPRPGPARKAVLVYMGRIILIDYVPECCEFANANCMIGATIRCIGSKSPCVVIEKWSIKNLFVINRNVPTGFPMGGQ
jgi:hypothetical protein